VIIPNYFVAGRAFFLKAGLLFCHVAMEVWEVVKLQELDIVVASIVK